MNCDRLARPYRWLEYGAFGFALERRRNAFLPVAKDACRVLLLGDGDGRFAARLLASCDRTTLIELVCVDSSAAMLELARRRLHSAVRSPSPILELVHTDARRWLCERQARIADGSAAPFDLVVTHFFLDCFSAAELPTLVQSIAGVATPGAHWLVSEFRQPPAGAGWRAWHAAAWLRLLYHFFRLTTGLTVSRLPDHRSAFAANGFRLISEQTARAGLLISESWRRSA